MDVTMLKIQNGILFFLYCFCSNIGSIHYQVNGFIFKNEKVLQGFAVWEETPIGTPLINVTTDPTARLYQLQNATRDVFGINATSGTIYVKHRLDREVIGRKVNFKVVAYEEGRDKKIEIDALFVIKDINDHTPHFSTRHYVVNITEVSADGAYVTTVTAEDEDIDLNGRVTYYIVGGNENGTFEIGYNTGDVKLRRNLDYEQQIWYQLNITATDGQGKANWTMLSINVRDADDLPARFSAYVYSAEVREDVPVGTKLIQVHADDLDKGIHAPVTYKIDQSAKDTNTDNLFRINSTTGQITLNGSLDRETQEDHRLRVLAFSTTHLPDHATVILTVTDANDNTPTFSRSSYEAAVKENADIGTTIVQVQAKDDDKGPNDAFIYVLANGVVQDFAIDARSGIITVNGTLDREIKENYSLSVFAKEIASSEGLYGNATVTITIADENDNDPVFTSSTYEAAVHENKPAGSFVVQVLASDADWGTNAVISYSLYLGGYGHHPHFRINSSSGSITTAQRLNRENVNSYHLRVIATDGASHATERSSSADVLVQVLDDNDNYPVFSQNSYNLTVTEAAPRNTLVGIVKAIDEDNTLNGQLWYSFVSGNTGEVFTIDKFSGHILVNGPLDREMVSVYSLVVMARDRGDEVAIEPNRSSSLNATIVVTISILDANDNGPVCIPMLTTLHILENASVGDIVARLNCADVDAEENGIVTYKMIANQSKFAVNSTSGEVYVRKELDFEEKPPVHTVMVQARDSGTPSLTGYAVVVIWEDNVNDNSPVFLRPRYSFSLFEGNYLDNPVTLGVIKATDPDADVASCPACGDLRYRLVNTSGPFFVDETEGILRANGTLDRETRESFVFTVMAVDSDPTNALANVTTVTITLLDVNDNDPRFERDVYIANISADALLGDEVIKVNSIDTDVGSNSKISYSIAPGNGQGLFSINQTTGRITVTQYLGHQNTSQYLLNILATDSGNPPRRSLASLIINVKDTNDNKPVCAQVTQTIRLSENLPPGQYVTQVNVKDNDNGVYSRLRYLLWSDDFIVDRFSGVVTTTRSLDRETTGSYNLTIAVKNGNGSNYSVNCYVHVIVEDANDHAPEFNTSGYDVSLLENATVGTTLLLVSAHDEDIHHNADIRYTLIGEGHAFSINETTGEITLTGSLDRETVHQYNIRVLARDRGLPQAQSSEVPLIVKVEDVNDNAPVFTHTTYYADVMEAHTGVLVVTVAARDRDQGTNAEVDYLIIDGNDGNAFKTYPNGSLYTALPLDRESVDKYELTVLAYDRKKPTLNNTAKVLVTVMDINDSPPNITNSPVEIAVPENIPPGSLVYVLRAEDIDESLNAEVTFTGHADPPGTFSIDSFGAVSTAGPLDRETAKRYTFFATATDGGNPALNSTTASFNIIITDENDNNPVFFPVYYTANISENSPLGESVISVNATEKDEGGGGQIVFAVFAGDPSGHFAINNVTGEISTWRSFDREQQARYDLVITASDHGQPARVGHGFVTILVDDANDMPPVFEHARQYIGVSEDVGVGHTILSLVATDKDIGNNALISYSIRRQAVGWNAFNITTEEVRHAGTLLYRGVITTATPLDRELQETYNLTVKATDGVHNSTTQVIITVFDTNDNPPLFNLTTSNISIYENTPGGTKIFTAQAHDRDQGVNAQISYFLEGAKGKFFISTSGDIYTSPSGLDRETEKVYNLTVIARDSGNLMDTLTVLVNVLDINDNPPRFSRPVYIINVTEATGHSTFNITASDLDDGRNKEIHYGIRNGNDDGIFNINNDTGMIISNELLDRERYGSVIDNNGRGVYTLVVEATDNGEPSLSSTTTVRVLIDDINDNAPVFEQSSYSFTVSEDALITHPLGRVLAHDRDWGSNAAVRYTLLQTAGSPLPFEVNLDSGVITVTRTLDYEATSVYNFTIKAFDWGNQSLSNTTIVHISVRDINDNPPVFSRPQYHVNVSESVLGGRVILIVTATDADSGDNAKILYRIIGGDLGKFTIEESTGVVRSVGSLDYESLTSYTLNVSATDSGHPPLVAFATVVVQVMDYNDQPPVFDHQFYAVNVTEGISSNGSVLLAARANDPDKQINSKIRYFLDDTFGVFEINASTGEIHATQELDREKQGNYKLRVTAMDNGDVRLKSEVTVTINVMDVNDNHPVFPESLHTLQLAINQDTHTGTVIARYTATDEDQGNNARLSYSLSGNLSDFFSVDQGDGTLSLVRSASRLAAQNISLVITCRDNGQPPLSSSIKVFVVVFYENRNAPKLSPRNIQISIYENTSRGVAIGEINATDTDVGEKLLYILISGGDEKFALNATTGELSVLGSLDRETQSFHKLFIAVTDTRDPPFSDYGTIEVVLLDVNDNAPTLKGRDTVFHVSENAAIGTKIASVSASDADEGINAEVFHSISRHSLGVFAINRTSGVIFTLRALDREENSSYSLTVIAENTLAVPPMRSQRTYLVLVDEVNDNFPVFKQQVFTALVSEDAPVGTVVIDLNATDIDKDRGEHFYKINHYQSSAWSSHFAVDPESGIVTTQVHLDREDMDNYTLFVEVHDIGFQKKNSSAAKVKVYVQDVNDNPPRFQKRDYRFLLSETTDLGHTIGKVIATDKDVGSNAIIRYDIIQGNEGDYFSINRSCGGLSVIKPLDYEANSSHVLLVRATDEQFNKESTHTRVRRANVANFDEAKVSIQVTDENDNQPEFTRDRYFGVFDYEKYDGSALISVKATDRDSRDKDSIIYRVLDQSTPDGLLLYPSTGQVSVNRASIHVNSDTLVYIMDVTAMDNGGRAPYNNASRPCEVLIFYLNENDAVEVTVGVPLEFVQEKREEVKTILQNITEGTVLMLSLKSSPESERSTLLTMYVIKNNSTTVLGQDDMISIFSNKRQDIEDQYGKWHFEIQSKTSRIDTRKKSSMSPSLAALFTIAVLIGFGGVIGIIILCRYMKYRRIRKNEFDPEKFGTTFDFGTTSNAVACYSIDIPTIGAYIESHASRTPNRYTITKGKKRKNGKSVRENEMESLKLEYFEQHDLQNAAQSNRTTKKSVLKPARSGQDSLEKMTSRKTADATAKCSPRVRFNLEEDLILESEDDLNGMQVISRTSNLPDILSTSEEMWKDVAGPSVSNREAFAPYSVSRLLPEDNDLSRSTDSLNLIAGYSGDEYKEEAAASHGRNHRAQGRLKCGLPTVNEEPEKESSFSGSSFSEPNFSEQSFLDLNSSEQSFPYLHTGEQTDRYYSVQNVSELYSSELNIFEQNFSDANSSDSEMSEVGGGEVWHLGGVNPDEELYPPSDDEEVTMYELQKDCEDNEDGNDGDDDDSNMMHRGNVGADDHHHSGSFRMIAYRVVPGTGEIDV